MATTQSLYWACRFWTALVSVMNDELILF
jgi:hypothetical protein